MLSFGSVSFVLCVVFVELYWILKDYMRWSRDAMAGGVGRVV